MLEQSLAALVLWQR